jgi:hypothetical protein
MNADHTQLPAGTFFMQAQEQVVFGRPAAQAVMEQVERMGARRVFLTSGRTLGNLDDGPLQRIRRALGDRHCGTWSRIRAHSPREDVIDGALAVFECFNRSQYLEGDHIIFVGEVEHCQRRDDAQPLIYHGGRFFTELPL